MQRRITRRRFSTGMVAAGAAAFASKASMGALGANDRVRLGFIGLGNRGDQLLTAFQAHKDAQFVALCDVYSPYIDFARKKVGGDPFTTKDYRHVLDRKDVDAVVIATPDHWHALQFIHACAAGKDVYVEKPVSLTIGEGRRMVEAAQRYERITQAGIQRRSAPICQRMVELIQSGAIGKVTVCRCYHLENESPMGIGSPADSEPPPELDWDMWLGPAAKVPYNENRCLYKFRWFGAYSGGQLTNMGTHYLDMIQWALGQDAPTGIVALGGRYAVDDNRDIPDTLEVVWEYPGGTLVTFSQYNANRAPADAKGSELEFRGTEGTMYYRGGRIEIVPEVVRTEPRPALNPLDRRAVSRQAAATRPAGEALVESGRVSEADHARNFLDCIKSRKPCICPVETGHRSTSATLLGNIALRRKRYIAWDAQAERVTNDPEANDLLNYEYRQPWKLG